MPTWRKCIFRTVGVLNALFAMIGAYWLSGTALWALFRLPPNPQTPYFRTVFAAMTATNLIFIALFLFAAIQLFRLRRSGVFVHAIMSVALIFYSALNGLLWRVGHGIGVSIGAATGVGNMGIVLFEFGFFVPYLYPIVSSAFLLLAGWKMSPAGELAR